MVPKIIREVGVEGECVLGVEPHRVEGGDAVQGLTTRSVGCIVCKANNNQPRGSEVQDRQRERILEQGAEEVKVRIVGMSGVRTRTNRWKRVVCVHHSREKSGG